MTKKPADLGQSAAERELMKRWLDEVLGGFQSLNAESARKRGGAPQLQFGFEIAEIDLEDYYLEYDDSEAMAIPVPPPPRKTAPLRASKVNWEHLLDNEQPAEMLKIIQNEKFSKRSRRLKLVEGPLVEPPSRPPYYPEYNYRTDEQLRWYFHWRSQARAGVLLDAYPTDVMLYAYEIINGIEFDSDEQAFNTLMALWRRYQAVDYQLQHSLFEFVEDFAVVRERETDFDELRRTFASEWVGISWPGEFMYLYKDVRFSDMPLPLLGLLGDVDMMSNAFYHKYGGEDLRIAVGAALDGVDDFWSRRKRLMRKYFRDEIPMSSRWSFQSAYYESPRKRIVIPAPPLPVRPGERIRALGPIIKHAINTLRGIVGYSHRLRSYTLSDELKAVVENAIQPLFVGRVKGKAARLAPPKPPEKPLVFDSIRVAGLVAESDEVRDRLLETLGAIDLAAPEAAPVAPIAALPPGTPARASRSAEDGDGWIALVRDLTEFEKNEVRAILNGDGGSAARAAGIMPQQIIDAINEKALDLVGDSVIERTGERFGIFDDYEASLRDAFKRAGN